jgi:hypothetical protein
MRLVDFEQCPRFNNPDQPCCGRSQIRACNLIGRNPKFDFSDQVVLTTVSIHDELVRCWGTPYTEPDSSIKAILYGLSPEFPVGSISAVPLLEKIYQTPIDLDCPVFERLAINGDVPDGPLPELKLRDFSERFEAAS